MRLLLVIMALALAGCRAPMTNEDIIRATRLCNEAGLTTRALVDIEGQVAIIQCFPKESK